MANFTDLKEGGYIWAIYNINWDKDKPSQCEFYPQEYKLEKYPIVKHELNVPRQYDISDRYEEPCYRTDYENYLEVIVEGKKYSRYYTNHYNEYRHMSMSCEYSDNGPWVEFFPDYETAKEYLITRCTKDIEYCNKQIEKENLKINLLKKSLEQIK